jgi:DNA polymerase-3 subunit delta
VIYLIHGSQEAVIDQEVKRIVNENLKVIDDFSLIRFDLTATLLQDVISDAETMPFGLEKKVIVVKNSYIFTTNILKKDKLEHDPNSLIDYLEHENPATILIFTVCADRLDNRSKLVEALKGKAEIKKTADVSKEDWPTVIQKLANKRELKFENKALEEFIKRTQGDINTVVNELEKLKTYGGRISLEVVESLVARPLEDKMFGMVDALLANRPEQATAIYDDLRCQNTDPAQLVTALANQFRFLYKVLYLNESGLNVKEIVKELNVVNPYRVNISLRKTRNKTSVDILKILAELAEIDYHTKTGQVDRFQALELFLVKEH